MWVDLARKWSEFESVAAGVAGTVVTIILIIIGRVMRFFRSRQADDALEMAKEAKALADENRTRLVRAEKHVSECYGMVLSLQQDMAAMSHHVEASADQLAESSRIIKEYTTRISKIVEDSGLSSGD